jgi:glycosyltransferase involved in cell wall biosynthesis
MKVAHFVQYAPMRSGLYETTREITQGQRDFLGWDARMIDVTHVTTKGGKRTDKPDDRGTPLAPLDFALKADVHVLHSGIPREFEGKKPTFFVAHGTPEYCFYSQMMLECVSSDVGRVERAKKGPFTGSWSLVTITLRDKPWVKGAITMWERHAPFWEPYFDNVIVTNHFCDQERFSPDGPVYEFQKPAEEDGLNIVFADHWRYTAFKDPFQLLHGAREFCLQTGSKIHLFAIPKELVDGMESMTPVIQLTGHPWHSILYAVTDGLKSVVGDLHTVHTEIEQVHRAADVLVTPAAEDNRTVLEATSCGCPVIARKGANAATETCRFEDPKDLTRVLRKVQKQLQTKASAKKYRNRARSKSRSYTVEKAVLAMGEGMKEALDG